VSDTARVDLIECARCGLPHRHLVVSRLGRPCLEYTHWAPCPVTGEPVLVRFDVKIDMAPR